MNDINTVISELIEIGGNYPKKRGGLFSVFDCFNGHHDQTQAQYLTNLNKLDGLNDAEKVIVVKYVVIRIYNELNKPNAFLKQIHQCLLNGGDFEAYRKASQGADDWLVAFAPTSAILNSPEDNFDGFSEMPLAQYVEMATVMHPREENPAPAVFDLPKQQSYVVNNLIATTHARGIT